MALTDYFSPVAFFILLRESLEAGIIIAVLLGFITQLVPSLVKPSEPLSGNSGPGLRSESELESEYNHRQSEDSARSSQELLSSTTNNRSSYGASRSRSRSNSPSPYGHDQQRTENQSLLSTSQNKNKIFNSDENENDQEQEEALEGVEGGAAVVVVVGENDKDKVIKKMKIQIWSGAILGGTVAMAIGAIFLYVFYTYTHDLWQDAENLWEGGFCLLASLLILVMSLAFLRLPHAQVKWRLKLLSAYQSQAESDPENTLTHHHHHGHNHSHSHEPTAILFGLPFITVLREGLEGVVFLGGIGLSEKGSAVAGGGIGGLVVGGTIAYLLFSSTTPLSLNRFVQFSSLLLFMIGAGLASRAAYSFERQYFISYVGTAAAEAGNGPGSYRVKGNIWHLTWWDPEPGSGDNMAQLAQAVIGWNNTGTIWTVSTYILYWVLITLTLVYAKYKEGRAALCGHLSKRGWEREYQKRENGDMDNQVLLDDRSDIGE
ncbi:uncharacterized protein IL334_004004 [Kwoniella shivajii]|uniref:Iron ion transporter n=1 Tax=Kwoniella shivajii TaxID=564305 RepID=A0ABZ1CZ83_9TREE|nr:hypothetical protein IL334_004004 [Kwoniella shivajii]